TTQYKCSLKFGSDALGELCCKVSGGWLDLCSSHGVLEGDRAKFSVAHYFASNVMYVCIYPRINVDTYLKRSVVEL
ncbi:hypothetical protein A2U01_0040972, partial [Trifolium medium]|nr:hypothetical protein [Trifolium medium]